MGSCTKTAAGYKRNKNDLCTIEKLCCEFHTDSSVAILMLYISPADEGDTALCGDTEKSFGL